MAKLEKCLSKLDEVRRVVLVSTLATGIVSLIGSEMPWVHITQDSRSIHTWSFISNASPNAPDSGINNNSTLLPSISTFSPSSSSSSNILKCNYTIDIYLSLYDAEMCQTFVSGYLPGPSNDYLIDISDFNDEDESLGILIILIWIMCEHCCR